MAKRRFSNLLALAVLSCLSEKPMHPYEISQTLRHRGKDQSIKLNYGALYGVVESLAKAGFIRAQEIERQGRRPERTIYSITDAGRYEHDDWLAELVSTPVRQYHSLEAGLALLAGLSPDQAAALLGERSVRLKGELGQVDAMLKASQDLGLPDIFVVEAEFRRAMLGAELRYVDELVGRIREERLSGVSGWRKAHQLMSEGITFEEIMQDPVKHLGEDAAMFAAEPQ